ncbi:MAG: PQQ-binding-like beta-propeller repeat protein [Methanocellales archaeon]
MEKNNEKTDAYYASNLPRVPEIIYIVNISANVGGELAEAVVEGDKIFLADHQGVYALNRSDGALIWGVEVYSGTLEGRAISYPQPLAKWRALGLMRFVEAYGIGKYLYIGTSSSAGEQDAYLIALDKDNGNLIWKVKLESEAPTEPSKVTSNLIVADGKIYVGSVSDAGYIYCVSEDGVLKWRSRTEANVRGLAHGDGILFSTSEASKKLYALNSNTGEKQWVFEHNAMLSTPSYKNGKLFLADSQGNILAVSKEGKLIWKKSLGISSDVNTNSYIAVSNRSIYAVRGIGERPRNLYILNFDGTLIGNYTFEKEENGGRPLASEDVVIVPVKDGYNKIYLLWGGSVKLSEFKLIEKEIWTPKVSVGYGEIYVVANPTTLIKLADYKKPVVKLEKVELNKTLNINAIACDKESALHKVLLVYSINGSKWNYREMEVSRKYAIQPIGGYGFAEELYGIKINIQPEAINSTVEFYIAAIDNSGNYETTGNYAYRITIRH